MPIHPNFLILCIVAVVSAPTGAAELPTSLRKRQAGMLHADEESPSVLKFFTHGVVCSDDGSTERDAIVAKPGAYQDAT